MEPRPSSGRHPAPRAAAAGGRAACSRSHRRQRAAPIPTVPRSEGAPRGDSVGSSVAVRRYSRIGSRGSGAGCNPWRAAGRRCPALRTARPAALCCRRAARLSSRATCREPHPFPRRSSPSRLSRALTAATAARCPAAPHAPQRGCRDAFEGRRRRRGTTPPTAHPTGSVPAPRCARPAGPAQDFIRQASPTPLPSLPPPDPARPAPALISAGLPRPRTSRGAGGHARGDAPPSSPQRSQRPYRPWEAGRERWGTAAAPFWGAPSRWDPARLTLWGNNRCQCGGASCSPAPGRTGGVQPFARRQLRDGCPRAESR